MAEQAKENKKDLVSKETLLETGIQFGHQSRRKNPKMIPFVRMERDRTSIIDLRKTMVTLNNAYRATNHIATKGGKFLFVGTTKYSSEAVKLNAERAGQFYIDHRWLGGLLTNWRTIQKSINRLRTLERLQKDDFKGYNKKEALELSRELERLERTLGGIKFMRRLPNAIFVTSAFKDQIAIAEAKKLKIPVFAIVDTDADPTQVQFPIVGNDDSNKAVALVTTLMADAILEAQGKPTMAAYKSGEGEKPEVMGIVDLPPRKTYRKNNNNSYGRNNDRPYNKNNDRSYNKTEKPVAKVVTEEVKTTEEIK